MGSVIQDIWILHLEALWPAGSLFHCTDRWGSVWWSASRFDTVNWCLSVFMYNCTTYSTHSNMTGTWPFFCRPTKVIFDNIIAGRLPFMFCFLTTNGDKVWSHMASTLPSRSSVMHFSFTNMSYRPSCLLNEGVKETKLKLISSLKRYSCLLPYYISKIVTMEQIKHWQIKWQQYLRPEKCFSCNKKQTVLYSLGSELLNVFNTNNLNILPFLLHLGLHWNCTAPYLCFYLCLYLLVFLRSGHTFFAFSLD